MPTAEEVANFLAYGFLKNGNYTASVGPVDVPDLAGAAAAAAKDEEVAIEYAHRAEPFGGLAVQSVGFEDGVREPKVHIYLTRGSSRLIKSLPDDIYGVPVRIHKMGLITVRPEAASAATNRGHFFERNNRVCCGSSCAPTSENCTGTFGAIVRKGHAQQLYLLSNNHVFAGCNHVPQNQPILAPSSNDGNPTVRAPGEIGRHHEIHELRSGNPVFVNPCDADLALARATNPNGISSWQGDGNDGYDTPSSTANPVSLMSAFLPAQHDGDLAAASRTLHRICFPVEQVVEMILVFAAYIFVKMREIQLALAGFGYESKSAPQIEDIRVGNAGLR
jgi:hypothetical protein